MVGLFSAVEMADLRGLVASAMSETATITRTVRAADGAGGFTTQPTTVAADVPVFRTPEVAGVGEAPVAGQMAQGLRWKLFFPVGTDVRGDDQVEIGADVYTVMDAAGPMTAEAARLVYALRRAVGS